MPTGPISAAKAFPRDTSRDDGSSWIKPRRERRLSDKWIVSIPSRELRSKGSHPTQQVSDPFQHIWNAIDRSKSILDLKEDWDGEGALAYSNEVWERAVRFVRRYALKSYERFGSIVNAPRILPGPNGSIDVHWKEKNFELLVNIPTDPKELASFYGDDYSAARIKGTFDPESENVGLIFWLTQHT